MQESAVTVARLWWLILVFAIGIGVIAFSQLTFSTGEKVVATVVDMSTEEGIAGKELILIVKTDDNATSKVSAKGAVNIGDKVTLNVLDRIYFRDLYRLE